MAARFCCVASGRGKLPVKTCMDLGHLERLSGWDSLVAFFLKKGHQNVLPSTYVCFGFIISMADSYYMVKFSFAKHSQFWWPFFKKRPPEHVSQARNPCGLFQCVAAQLASSRLGPPCLVTGWRRREWQCGKLARAS